MKLDGAQPVSNKPSVVSKLYSDIIKQEYTTYLKIVKPLFNILSILEFEYRLWINKYS